MGLFDNFFKSTPTSKVRGKLTDLVDFLSKCALGEINHSFELAQQKASVMLNEIIELEAQCSPTDKVKLDFPTKSLEVPVKVAVLAAEYWIDAVLVKQKYFTNSSIILMIDKAENDFRTSAFRQEDEKGNNERLSHELPNYLAFMNEASSFIANCFKITDTATKLEFRAPITTFGMLMGANHYIVEKSQRQYTFHIETNGNGGKRVVSKNQAFYRDLSPEEYNTVFLNVSRELMQNPLYMKITTG